MKKKVKNYNKLIRDRILEIIKAAGERPYSRVLNKKVSKRERGKKRSFMAFPPRLKGKSARGQYKPVRKKSKMK